MKIYTTFLILAFVCCAFAFYLAFGLVWSFATLSLSGFNIFEWSEFGRFLCGGFTVFFWFILCCASIANSENDNNDNEAAP